jgi:predicted Zn-dependent peptidase
MSNKESFMKIIAPLAAFFTAAAGLSVMAASAAAQTLDFPVQYHKLSNGLRVVLSPDATAPVATVAVYYRIGFRIEPKNRTGFAHLFEHMMFQGSKNLGKMEFIRLIENNGGVLNGSTRFDFTNYFEIVPAHVLETALWAEADRMRGLDLTQENLTNQQGVVTNEVKGSVLNQPYGGFPWLDLPQAANKNWYNAHNFYGDLQDLAAATLTDVQSFFKTFYAPNNAVLVLTGDFEPAAALALVKKHFENIPAAILPPPPDLTEPRQEKEIRVERVDPLAQKPALAFGYHMPDRGTPEYFAMGLIDQILLQGEDSRLYRTLVQEKGITSGVSGGINGDLGNMFDYNGPMLWSASLVHDAGTTPEAILRLIDEQIEQLRTKPVEKSVLDRALIKMRSGFYDQLGGFFGFGRANLLASYALFDDHPEKVNVLENEFKKVTPALILRTAKEILRPANRTIVVLKTKTPGR